MNNVILGIAQGAGTAGNNIANGVLTDGVDSNQSGIVPGTAYYLSNTPGTIATSAGTISRVIGKGTPTATDLIFNPNFNTQPTDLQKTAIVNSALYTNGYAADAGSTDDYAITLSPNPGAYTTGMTVVFKANTANTGASTLNVNGLGAKTIKKNKGFDLETGDIRAGQDINVTYDGTNFQMVSPISALNRTMYQLGYLRTGTVNTEQNLVSITVPGGLLGTVNALRFRTYIGTNSNHVTGGTFTMKVKWGGNTLLTKTNISTDNLSGSIDIVLSADGATGAQRLLWNLLLSAVGTASSSLSQTYDFDEAAPTVDSTTDQTFAVTYQWQNTGAIIDFHGTIVEAINYQ